MKTIVPICEPLLNFKAQKSASKMVMNIRNEESIMVERPFMKVDSEFGSRGDLVKYSLFTLRRARPPLILNGERALLRVNIL